MTLTFEKLKVVFTILQEAMQDLESQAQALSQKDQEINALKASLQQLSRAPAEGNGHQQDRLVVEEEA